MAGKVVHNKQLEEYENENYYLLWCSCLDLSDEDNSQSHGPITLYI